MTTAENKELVRRYYEEVVNTGNVRRLDEFIAPDYVEVYHNERYPGGIEGARTHIDGVRATYPDLHLTIERQIAEGEWVATIVTARGTQRLPWMEISPTGETLEYSCVNVDRVVDGRIVEHGGAADMLGPLLQAGAVEPSQPAED